MKLVAVTHHPMGPRLYVLGRRVHHADCGLIAILVGIAACLFDLPDRREWMHFRREVV